MTSAIYPLPERAETSEKRRSIFKEALPLLITLIAGLICYGLFFRRGLGLSVIGYSLSPASRVMEGEMPYRDFLFNYTPGTLWINALLMKAFGETMIVSRTGLLVFKLMTLIALFYVARRLTSAWSALVAVALTLAWLGHRQIFNVYPDQYLILFALTGLACMLSYDERGQKRSLFLCGASAALVFVFKHNVGLYLFAASATAIFIKEIMEAGLPKSAQRIKAFAIRFAIYSAGFSSVAGAMFIYLFSNHAFGAMIDHFLHHAAEYSETRAVGLPPLKLLRAMMLAVALAAAGAVLVFRKAPKLFSAYLALILALGSFGLLIPGRAYVLKESTIAAVAYFPPLIFAAVFGLGLWQLRNRFQDSDYRRAWWQRNRALTITGLFAFGVYLEVFPRADYYHLVRVLPVVFLFFFLFIAQNLPAVKAYFGKLPSPATVSLLLAAVPLVVLLIAGLLDTWWPQFDSKFRFKDRTELSIERGRGILVEKKQAELAEGLVRLIEENSSPDEPVFSFSQRGSSLYFLAARRNPSRLLWWSSVGIKDEDRNAVMNLISEKRPKLIVIQDIPANDKLRDRIRAAYHQVGIAGDIAVYNRNE